MSNVLKRFILSSEKLRWLQVYWYRKLDQIFKKPLNQRTNRFLIHPHQGLTLLIDRLSLVDSNIVLNGSWEKRQTSLLMNVCKKVGPEDVVFIDIGAYWGLYSLLSARIGVGEIHAFEPDPQNRAQLISQLFLNGVNDLINVHSHLLSNSIKKIGFQKSQSFSNGNRAISAVVENDSPFLDKLDCIDFDSVLDLKNRLLVIKIDVEGYELPILEGMKRTFDSNNVFLQIEFNEGSHYKIDLLQKTYELTYLGKISVDHYFSNSSIFKADWYKKDLE